MTADIEQDHEALLQFLYMAPIGLVQTRLDGEILLINPLSAQLLMPLSRDGDLANLFTALEPLAPDLRYRVAQFDGAHGMVVDALQLQVQGGAHGQVQGHAQGRKQAQYLSLSLLKLDGERLMAVLGDVTQSVQRERALRQNQAWIDALVVGLADYALLSLDAAGCIQEWNPSVGRVTGFTPESTVGRSCALFYPPDALPAEGVLDRLREADRAGWSLDEGWRQRADGTRFWGSCLVAPLQAQDVAQDEAHRAVSDEERSYSLIIRDVSDRREAAEALRQSIACDHLTGLANRRAFFEAAEVELQRWMNSPRPLAVVMFDADHFKAVNDRHGHAAGDAVLRHLAAALSSSFRAMDVVARIGGEEFAVLLPGATLEVAEALASQVCRHLAAQAVEVAGARIACTVSAGVAAMAPGTAGIDGLLNYADAALYAAKANGRNRVECWQATHGGSALVTPSA